MSSQKKRQKLPVDVTFVDRESAAEVKAWRQIQEGDYDAVSRPLWDGNDSLYRYFRLAAAHGLLRQVHWSPAGAQELRAELDHAFVQLAESGVSAVELKSLKARLNALDENVFEAPLDWFGAMPNVTSLRAYKALLPGHFRVVLWRQQLRILRTIRDRIFHQWKEKDTKRLQDLGGVFRVLERWGSESRLRAIKVLLKHDPTHPWVAGLTPSQVLAISGEVEGASDDDIEDSILAAMKGLESSPEEQAELKAALAELLKRRRYG